MDLGKPIASGNTSDIFLHDGKIVKVFTCLGNRAAPEANKQRYVLSLGVCVPEIYAVTEINGKQAIVMEHINGKSLGYFIEKKPSSAPEYLALSVELQHALHSLNADGLDSLVSKLEHQLTSVSLSDKQKQPLLDMLHSMCCGKKLCHGDYHVYNIIQSESDTVIIDWADCSCGNIRADVCRSYLLYLQISKELASIYLHCYCDKAGISCDEILAWLPIIAGARLSEKLPKENYTLLMEIINNFFI